jgi:hypothetical protein
VEWRNARKVLTVMVLHNQSTILLRQALREQGTRVVTTVGFYL